MAGVGFVLLVGLCFLSDIAAADARAEDPVEFSAERAIAEAEICIAYGCIEEAEEILKAAALRAPTDVQIANTLAALRS